MSVATMQRPWDKAKEAPAPVSNSAGPIDELARLRDQLKTMQAREKELVTLVKDMGDGEHLGEKCKAVVSTVMSNRLDTAALKDALPEEMIAKYTVESPTVRVTIKPLV